MLSERQLQELLKVFEQRMQGVTDDYIRRMGTHLKDIGTLTDTDIHRLKQLKRVNANVEAIKRQMARAAEASVEDIEKVFRVVAESDSEFAREMFAENHTPGVKADRIKTLSSPIERILKAQLRVTAQEMANLSRTTVIADSYKAAVDVAVQTVQSGITDYQSAIRSALKKAAADGLRVEYQSGYTRRLDSAIRQNVLDGVRALNRDVLEQLGKEYGADGVEISAHALCAEDHLPYQGRQFSDKEFDRLQNMLDRPFGMWNCKHTIYPIILGVSPPAHSPEELQMYRTNSREQITIDGITMSRYEWSQQQRRMETAIREQKCIAIGAKAAGDDPLWREAQRNINRLQAQYAKISDAAGLYQQPERMSVAGFRKVKTAEELTSKTNNGIMKVASGGRRNEEPLTEKQVQDCMNYAVSLGMPVEQIRHRDDMFTSYFEMADVLFIGTDVYPAIDAKRANSRISYKGTIAHELVGHRGASIRGTVQGDPILEEAQASIRAAKFAKGLTDEDRELLWQDARDRLKDAGYSQNVLNDLDIWEE